jgi:hypothetical protein
MHRIAVLALIAAGLVVAAASPALAGKPNNTAPSRIAIATINGVPMGSTVQAITTRYGDTLTFATTIEKLSGNQWPMISVSCYQDVNGDGRVDTNLLGPDIVFGLLDHPTSSFQLAGSSLWSQRGGNATCHADLYAYGFKGGSQTIRFLAGTENWGAAW